MPNWVLASDPEDFKTKISHLDGVPWHEAPAPPRRHEHWAQTDGWINYFDQIQRCPCGAMRTNRWDMKWWLPHGDVPRVAASEPWRPWRRRGV